MAKKTAYIFIKMPSCFRWAKCSTITVSWGSVMSPFVCKKLYFGGLMQIDILLFLQKIREASDVLTAFFNLISNAGAGSLAMIIVAVSYWCIDKSLGIRMGLSMAVGSIFNQTLKNILCVNRPWIKDARVIPDAKALPAATGYSFPSGHSQLGMGIYGTIAMSEKHRKARMIMWLMVAMVGLSRLFLGVHTPLDVFCGLLVGGAGIFAANRLYEFAADNEKNGIKFVFWMGLAAIIFLLVMSFKPYPVEYVNGAVLVDPKEMITDCYRVAALVLGIAVSIILEKKYVGFDNPDTRGKSIVRGMGIAGVWLVHKISSFVFFAFGAWAVAFFEIFLPIVFVYVIWPLIFMKIEAKRG